MLTTAEFLAVLLRHEDPTIAQVVGMLEEQPRSRRIELWQLQGPGGVGGAKRVHIVGLRTEKREGRTVLVLDVR